MRISPHEISGKQFKKTLRGYDPMEVSRFLEMLALQFEELQKENANYSQKIVELETQLKDFRTVERAMQDTFLQAQETTGKAIEVSRKEAQLIIQEAELKASQILDKARNDLILLKEQITILKAKKDSIGSRLKMLLNSELELIKTLEVDEELQEEYPVERRDEVTERRREIEEILKSLEQHA